jgi:hypothetical protein
MRRACLIRRLPTARDYCYPDPHCTAALGVGLAAERVPAPRNLIGVFRCLTRRRMEGALPIATLAVTIWVMRFLLPKAVREDNSLALASAVISVAVAVWLWFIAGFVRVSS